MLMAWVFGIISGCVIFIAGFVWLTLSTQSVKVTWKHFATKMTSNIPKISLCYRCAVLLTINKCYKLDDNNLYCPVCTAIVGTKTAETSIGYTIDACKVAIGFFGIILLMAILTIAGIVM